MKFRSFIMVVLALAGLFVSQGCAQSGSAGNGSGQNWVGTWASSAQEVEAQLMHADYKQLDDTTLRQIVRVSLGGEKLRVRISNAFADWQDNLQVSAVYIAETVEGNKIKPDTAKQLTFAGNTSVSVPSGTLLVSDPIDFALKPGTDLTITMHVTKAPRKTTGHRSARGPVVHLQKGNAVTEESLASSVTNGVWYYICGVEVLASKSSASVVCLGDSITDGKGSTEGTNRRWPDMLARRLQADPAYANLGVLNQGIGGNCVVAGGIGQPVLQRLDRDVLVQPGARWVVLMEGINDIGGRTSAEAVIAGYEQIIARTKACGMKIYGITVLPCGGSGYYNPNNEAKRQKINEWIRTSGAFDAVIDWDAVIKDPQNPEKLRAEADCGDHLHITDAGYQMMVDSLDLKLFAD